MGVLIGWIGSRDFLTHTVGYFYCRKSLRYTRNRCTFDSCRISCSNVYTFRSNVVVHQGADSVAEKPISASSDSRMYQRCLCTTSPSPKLILNERCLRWMKLILRMKLIRWKNLLALTVGISSVPNVLRKKSCSCVRSSSCTRSSCSASTT